MEDVCAIELSIIEECLAQDDGSGSDDLCQDGLDRCSEEADDNNGSMILSNDSPYHGAPLPDTCIRVANVSGKQKVVERYNEVRSQCFDLEGWSYGIQVDEKETHGDDRSNPNFDKSTLKIGVGCFFGGIVLGALVIGMLVTRRTQTPVVLPRREEDPKEQLEGFVNGLAA